MNYLQQSVSAAQTCMLPVLISRTNDHIVIKNNSVKLSSGLKIDTTQRALNGCLLDVALLTNHAATQLEQLIVSK